MELLELTCAGCGEPIEVIRDGMALCEMCQIYADNSNFLGGDEGKVLCVDDCGVNVVQQLINMVATMAAAHVYNEIFYELPPPRHPVRREFVRVYQQKPYKDPEVEKEAIRKAQLKRERKAEIRLRLLRK